MGNEKSKHNKKPAEKRSGKARRKFAYGYQGKERRKSTGRRKDDKHPK